MQVSKDAIFNRQVSHKENISLLMAIAQPIRHLSSVEKTPGIG